MAKEYIERDELHKAILTAYITAEQFGFELSEDVVLLAIEQQPAADVVEVRHGRWMVGGMFDDFGICSSCGVKYPMSVAATEFNYCPNCGAKMDGGNGDASNT